MHTIHVISHTHWDREWYLTFQQFRFRLVELIDQLLALLDADPEYRYFMLDGQAIVVEDYLDVRPEREQEIRRHVQEGRLLIGPWYILPDEFLVSPEATVRNLLIGQRVCGRFGPQMGIGYIPDPFGHIGQMPQILRGFGIETACMWRGIGDQPTEFHWRAPDGSVVLLLHLRDSYSNAAWLPVEEDGFVQGIAQLRDSLAAHAATSHVLAMQGTDHMLPRADLPRLLAAADARLDDTRVVHSTLPRYLSAVRDELGERESRLPVLSGELRSPQRAHLLPGVLSTRMWIKQRNHACETLLEKWAEPFGTLGALANREADDTSAPNLPVYSSTRDLTRRAWKYLLENHPHDSICGCSVDQVHREMVTRFDWCEQIGEEVTRRALQALAQQIHTATPAIIVFNPATAPRTDAVTVEIVPAPSPSQPLLDASGQPTPYRILSRQAQGVPGMEDIEIDRDGFAFLASQFRAAGGRIPGQLTFRHAEASIVGDTVHIQIVLSQLEGAELGPFDEMLEQVQALLADESIQRYSIRFQGEGAATIRFVARDVPPMGYTSYTLAAEGQAQETESREQEATSVENEFFRVEADGDDGALAVTDKRTGRTLRGCNRFVDGGDRGDEYNYCQLEHDCLVNRPAASPTIRLLTDDDVGATLEIALDYQVPISVTPGDRSRRVAETTRLPITTRVSLTAGVPRVDFETTVENHARDHRLRVHFPTGLDVDAARADGHFDVVERPLDLPTDTEGWAEQPVPTHPQRAFVDVSNGEHGVMLANRGLPEYEALRGDDKAKIALTLLRCISWLSRDDMHCRQSHAGPAETTPEAQCPGRHTFHYSLIPHAGDYRRAHALAYAFQTDLRALSTGAHPGPLPATLSFVSAEPATLEVSAVKEPEEGEGLIVRCWNVDDAPADGVIRLWRPFRRATRVNLAEQEIAELARDADVVTLPVRGREIVTVRFEF
jgi:alpha-mannosidase